MRSRPLFQLLTPIGLAALVLPACGGSSKKKSSSSSSGNSGGTLTTVAKAAPSGSPDPQIDYTLQEWQLLILSHDGLVGFKRAGGTEGTKIVPDLATTVPKPTDGGKTYAFTLRKGIKFSNGKTLKASDVKEWSKDAQPDGNPDVIVQKFGLSAEAQVTQVENGQADWMFDTPPADRLNEMSTKYADQVHVNPLTAVYYYAFGVNTPPFNNLKARQAVNFATDRNALVKIYGGPKLPVPPSQILPPNFPAYKPYCPDTINPGT